LRGGGYRSQPDAATTDALLARLAIDLAAERDAAPISLDADGSRRHGFVYDRFTHAHLAARVAKLKGAPFNPERPPASLFNKWLVVVAVPLSCGGRTVRPTDVDIVGGDGRAIQEVGPQSGAAAAASWPGPAACWRDCCELCGLRAAGRTR
jgi:hypothetical protein